MAEATAGLLLICRSGGSNDVPCRSIATQRINKLGDQAKDLSQLDVLRPACSARLRRRHITRSLRLKEVLQRFSIPQLRKRQIKSLFTMIRFNCFAGR